MRTFLAVLVLGSAVALGGCTQQTPTPAPTLVEVTHSQSKAVPNFDSSEQVETDPERLAELQALIAEYEWDGSQKQDSPGCTGGTGTELQLEWSDGTTDQWSTYRCDEVPEFVVKLTDLVGSWR